MKERTLNDFLVNGQFKYDSKLTPLENYQYFQQSIAFGRGVEFISHESVNRKKTLYLYNVPGLSIDLKKARQELKVFYNQLLTHINEIINQEDDAFVIYSAVYDLFKEVQDDLKNPAPVTFLAIENVMHNLNALADIRKRNIPLIGGTRKGAFMEHRNTGFSPLAYDQLGYDIKEFIIKLFKNQTRFKKKLRDDLHVIITQLFNNNELLKHYRYTGEVADIVEIAIILFDGLEIFGDKPLTFEQFCKNLAGSLGVQVSKISNQYKTLIKRKARQELIIKKKAKDVAEFIDNINRN